MRISLHDVFEMHFHILLVGVKGLVIIDDGMFGAEMVFAEKGFKLKFARHVFTWFINEL